MLIWKIPTSRPRDLAGAISAKYTGPTTDDAPIPNPPINLNTTSDGQFQANAHPSDDTRYNNAVARNVSRPPHFSPGIPANIAPMTVPHSAADTVNPSCPGDNPNVVVS